MHRLNCREHFWTLITAYYLFVRVYHLHNTSHLMDILCEFWKMNLVWKLHVLPLIDTFQNKNAWNNFQLKGKDKGKGELYSLISMVVMFLRLSLLPPLVTGPDSFQHHFSSLWEHTEGLPFKVTNLKDIFPALPRYPFDHTWVGMLCGIETKFSSNIPGGIRTHVTGDI